MSELRLNVRMCSAIRVLAGHQSQGWMHAKTMRSLQSRNLTSDDGNLTAFGEYVASKLGRVSPERKQETCSMCGKRVSAHAIAWEDFNVSGITRCISCVTRRLDQER